MRKIAAIRVGALGLGLLLPACGSGGPATVQGTLGALLPSPELFDPGLDNGVGGASVGQTSDVGPGLLDILSVMELPGAGYCHIHEIITSWTSTFSTTTITETRFTGGQQLDVLRFEHVFQIGEISLCEDQPNDEVVHARVDVAVWDAAGNELTIPAGIGSIANILVIVQLSPDGTFDADDNVGPSVAIAMATAVPSTPVASLLQDTDFPAIPGDLTGFRRMSFFFDLDNLGGTGGGGTEPNTLMTVLDWTNPNAVDFLTFIGFPTAPGTDQPLAVDVRVRRNVGITMALAATDEVDPNVMRLMGPAFLVADGSANQGAGFAIWRDFITQLFEGWNATFIVTHDVSTGDSYQVPPQFSGWPGDSTLWTSPFGWGISDGFTEALAALPAVSTWFAGSAN